MSATYWDERDEERIRNPVERSLELYGRATRLYPSWAMPNPVRRCTECAERAALYLGEEAGVHWCWPCARNLSHFVPKMPPDDVRQLAADAAMEVRGI